MSGIMLLPHLCIMEKDILILNVINYKEQKNYFNDGTHQKIKKNRPTNESIDNEKLCLQINRSQYDYWRDNRYVGIPNEKAKSAMIDSIKLFEKYLGEKYNDNYMTKPNIEGTNYKKMQLEYWRRQYISDIKSDFAFCMFEGEDDYYILNIFANYRQFFYKVDDIIRIENLYKEVVVECDDGLW